MKSFIHPTPRTILWALLVLVLLVTSCATHNPAQSLDPPGFWSGLLHGFIILFSFIGSLFTDYEMYAFPNAGGWYDFGFMLGASIFFGGSGAKARR